MPAGENAFSRTITFALLGAATRSGTPPSSKKRRVPHRTLIHQ